MCTSTAQMNTRQLQQSLPCWPRIGSLRAAAVQLLTLWCCLWPLLLLLLLQIFERKPTTVKNFGIWVRYQSRTGEGPPTAPGDRHSSKQF